MNIDDLLDDYRHSAFHERRELAATCWQPVRAKRGCVMAPKPDYLRIVMLLLIGAALVTFVVKCAPLGVLL